MVTTETKKPSGGLGNDAGQIIDALDKLGGTFTTPQLASLGISSRRWGGISERATTKANKEGWGVQHEPGHRCIRAGEGWHFHCADRIPGQKRALKSYLDESLQNLL